MNAEAHELHGTERSPLSQFILPHVDEHGRTLSKNMGNSTHYAGCTGTRTEHPSTDYVNVLHGVLHVFSACMNVEFARVVEKS